MRFRRMVSLLLLAAYLPACTSYQPTTQPLAELTASPKPLEHVRVTTVAGATLTVDAPRVVDDSLFGTTVVIKKGAPTTQPVAMPLADIRTVQVRKSDGTATMVLVVGIVGAAVLIGVATSNALDDWTLDFAE